MNGNNLKSSVEAGHGRQNEFLTVVSARRLELIADCDEALLFAEVTDPTLAREPFTSAEAGPMAGAAVMGAELRADSSLELGAEPDQYDTERYWSELQSDVPEPQGMREDYDVAA